MADLSERRNITRIGLSLLLMLVLSLVLQAAAALLLDSAKLQQNNWLMYGAMFIPQYLIAMPVVYLLFLRRVPITAAPEKKLGAKRFIKALLVCYAIVYGGNLIALLITEIIKALADVQMTNLVGELVKGTEALPGIVFLGLAAPVAEEIFYRKLLITRLRRYGEKTAVIVSGLVFGLAHGNISQFFYAFGIGLAFGYIFVKTGKIGYTIALHIFINMIGGVIAPLIVNNYSETVLASLFGLGILGMAVAGLVLFLSNRKKIWFRPGECALDNWKKAFFLNAAMVLFFIACAVHFTFNTLSAISEL